MISQFKLPLIQPLIFLGCDKLSAEVGRNKRREKDAIPFFKNTNILLFSGEGGDKK
jgi:hypothetical protein